MGDALGHLLGLPCPLIKSVENYNNSIWVGVLTAQTLQECRLGSPQQVKSKDQLRRLQKAQGVHNGQWKKIVLNYSYDRNVQLSLGFLAYFL